MVDPSVYPFYQRLSQNPDDAEALFVLWQWYGDRHEFQQLATLVEQVAARRLDPASAADLFFRAGELWAKNVGRVDKAVGNYRRAFELDTAQIQALEAARAIYLQLGNYKLAAQLYEKQLAATPDRDQRAALLRELAAVRGQMGDVSGQIAALEGLVSLAPDDFELLRELAGAYIARAQAPDGSEQDSVRAAGLLAAIAQGLGGEHTLAFAEAALDAWPGEETAFELVREAYAEAGREGDLALRQIAFLAASPDSRLAPAIRRDLAALYTAAGQLDDAITALEPLAGSDPEAARALVDLYRQAGRTQELAELLTALPPASDPAQRMADLRQVAEIHGQRGEREPMIAALRQILAIDPADPEALALVEDDCRARSAYDELREVLLAAARAAGAPAEARRARMREIALLCEQRLSDVPGAIEAWRALLAIDPGDEEASGALERLLARAERWDELARWIEKRATSMTDRAARRLLWERLAELHRVRRNDPAGEAAALGALWALEPEDDAVAVRLIEARRAAGDAPGVAEVLRARAEAAEGAKAVARWTELAAHLEAVGACDEALHAWRHVAELEPTAGAAWEAVERLLEATGRNDLLLETLIAHAEGPGAGDGAAALHATAADVARGLGDVATATEQAERALALDGGNEAVAALLADLYEAAGERDKLIALLRGRADRAPDGDARLDVLRRCAQVVGQADPEGAARVWREVREVAKRAGRRDDAEALEALVGFAEVSGDSAGLAELLREMSMFVSEPAQQRALLVRRAEILAGELDRVAEAIETLRDVAERVDPGYAPAWGTIADLALASGKPAVAADALARQLEIVTDDDERRAAVAARLGALCETELGDRARAIAAYETQYDADPTDYALVERLSRLCEAEGRWADVVKYLEVLAEIEGDDDELSALVRRIATIAEQNLGSARKAFDVLAPQARAGDAAALEALRGAAERGGLEAELVDVLTELAGRAGGADERAALWREVARRCEAPLGDPRRALDAWQRALLARPGAPDALEPVDRLALALGDAATAAAAYRAVLADVEGAEATRAVGLRGVALLERIGARDAALDLAVAAHGRAPGDDALLDAVVRLAAAARRGDEMFIALDRRRKAAGDEAARFGLLLRAAESAVLLLGDRDTALGYLQQAANQAIAGKAPDEERLGLLESAAREVDGRVPDAALRTAVVELYRALGDDAAEVNPRAAAVLGRRAGEVCERDLGLAEHAFAFYARAVAVWPADTSSADRLEAVARAAGRAGEVVELYRGVIDEAYDAETARRYQTRRAALLGEVLGRVDEAIEELRGVVESAPKDLGALRTLQAALRAHGRHQDLLLALDRELELGPPDRAAVLREIATIWERGLRNAFEARDAWKRVLKHSADDAEALAALERLDRRRAAGASLDEAGSGAEDAGPPAAAPSPPTQPNVAAWTGPPAGIIDDGVTPAVALPPPDPDPDERDGDRAARAAAHVVAPVSHHDEPSAEVLAPDALEELEALDAELEPEEIEAFELPDGGDDEAASLDTLAGMAVAVAPARPSRPPSAPPPPRKG